MRVDVPAPLPCPDKRVHGVYRGTPPGRPEKPLLHPTPGNSFPISVTRVSDTEETANSGRQESFHLARSRVDMRGVCLCSPQMLMDW